MRILGNETKCVTGTLGCLKQAGDGRTHVRDARPKLRVKVGMKEGQRRWKESLEK